MTKEEAITYLEDAKHNLPYKFGQALDMAIEALSTPSGDLISRADAINTLETEKRCTDREEDVSGLTLAKLLISALPSAEAIPIVDLTDGKTKLKAEDWVYDDAPSTDAEPKWNCTATFVAEQLDKLKDMSVSKKLKLIQDILGVEFKEENLNYKHASAETVHGEWTYLSGSKGSYMTISCPICGSTFDDVAEWKYHFCPNCGTRLFGEDGEEE